MSRVGRGILLVAMVAAAAVAVRLGIWQLHRLSARKASNAIFLAARDLPPVNLGSPDILDSTLIGRRVEATGQFLGRGTVKLRNRAYRDAPGLYLVTPFELAGSGKTVWVLRGFVNAANGVTPRYPLPAFIPGRVTITGITTATPTSARGAAALVVDGDTTWQHLDSTMLAERIPGSLPVIVHLEGPASGPGGLPTIEMPELSDGPHFSYAVQWFGIAIAILSFGFIVFRRPTDREPAPPRGAP